MGSVSDSVSCHLYRPVPEERPRKEPSTGDFGPRRERWQEGSMSSDEVRGPALSGQRYRLVIERDARGAVAGFRLDGEGFEERLD